LGFYNKYFLPKIAHFLCSHEIIRQQRQKVVPLAKGRVLEIGIGSGLNLPFYDPERVASVWGLDPSEKMWKLADTQDIRFGVEFIHAPAEAIPLEDGIADTVVATYTLCTVPDIMGTLGEIRRVLKPGGELVFCEHGAAPEERLKQWQDRLNPIWKTMAGGCNLNRQIPALLERGGFKIQKMDAMFIEGAKIASFNYWGTAAPQKIED
jgi:ubiquinone/menaquinone biosynthesis C-methylase UbiE